MQVLYRKRGRYWYYKLEGAGFVSSGQTSKHKCIAFVAGLLGTGDTGSQAFSAYAQRFFIWETCPHVARLLDEGKSITRRYVREQRINLEAHILPSPLSDLSMDRIRRSHIIDFRSSLRSKGLAYATVNKIISCLKVIFSEAEYRQDILMNPSAGIGKVKGTPRTIGILTPEELKCLFPENFTVIWGDRCAYTCFLLASSTGMRRGEVLALRWKHLHFDKKYISVEEAWKDVQELGPPKWGIHRTVPMSRTLKEALLVHRDASPHTREESLVFCYPDGSRLGATWWRKRFAKALGKAGIQAGGRRLHPHVLRHSINTFLRNAGENPDKIRASLGWSSEAMQDAYTHWGPEHLKHQGNLVDSIWDTEDDS